MSRPQRPELRELLLDTAAVEFARLGLGGVSLSDIAAEIGVTKGAVYFHFSSKMELFHACLARLEAQRQAHLDSLPPPDPKNPLDQLRHLLEARLSFGLERPELRRLHWILDTELSLDLTGSLRGGIRAEHRRLRADIRHLLHLAGRQGLIPPLDPATEAFRLCAALEGTLSLHQASPEDLSVFLDPEPLVLSWLAPLKPRRRRSPTRDLTEPDSPPQETRPDSDTGFQPAF